MFRVSARLATVGLFGLLLHPSLANAAAVRWNNVAGGNWNVAANWSPAAVPTATDTAVIDLAGTYSVVLNVNVSLAALRVSGAASGVQTVTGTTRTVTLANASSIGAQGALTLTTTSVVNGAGAITNDGTVSFSATTVAQAFTNRGTLLIQPTACTFSGAFTNAAGGLLRVTAAGSAGQCIISNGFTNSGAIELTSTGALTSNLTVTTGTLVNAPGATITTFAGGGGARQLNAQFDNQGTIDIQQATTTIVAGADHLNSGSINVTGGNYTITLNAPTPSFTTTGSVSVAAGKTFAVTGSTGFLFNYNGGTLGGAGTVSVTNVTLALGTGLASSSTVLGGSNATLSGPATYTVSTGTTVALSNYTITAPTTVQAGATLQLSASDMTGALTNGGTVEFTGVSSTSGLITTQTGSTLRVLGSSTASTLTSSAGFTNSATLELTTIGGGGTVNLTVTTGTLVNAPTGVIKSLVGGGGVRQLNAELDNQGTIDIQQATTTTVDGADHLNSGSINVTGGNYTITLRAPTPTFTTTGAVSVAAGKTFLVNNGTVGGTGFLFNYNGGTLGGAGTVSATNVTLGLGVSLAAGTTNFAGNGIILNGPGTFTVNTGTTLLLPNCTLNANTVVQPGATLQLDASDMTGPLTNGGTVEFTAASTSSGLITTQPGSMLRLIAGSGGASTLTVANGFTNTATLELTSTAISTASMTVTAGTLVNAPAGVIRSVVGGGGARALNAKLDNQGAIDVLAALSTSKVSTSHVNSGAINVTGGNYTIGISGVVSTFTNTGTISVAPGRTLFLNGGVAGGAGFTYDYAGGTLAGGGIVRVANATLALHLAWPTSNAQLQTVNAAIAGPDTLRVSSGSAPSLDSTVVTAPVTVESGGTFRIFGSNIKGRLNNAGVVEVGGASHSTGDFITLSGSTLRVLGTSASSSLMIFPDTWINSALIELTSSSGSPLAAVTLTTGSLINTTAGIVRSLTGTGGPRQVNAGLTNSGLFDVQVNTSMNAAGGLSLLNSGTIDIAPTHTLTMLGSTLISQSTGLITGSGTVTLTAGDGVGQNGTIRPGGTSPGVLRFNSSMLMNSTARLEVELGGDSPVTGYDQIQFRDAATLGGTLAISTVTGYQPVPGRRYQIARFPSRFGTFANVTGLDYGAGQMWAVTYSDTDVVLLAMDETWSRVHPDGAWPVARDGHAAVYDSTGDRMVVFGGRTDAGPQNDVWVLTKATGFNYPAWAKLSPAGTPPAPRTNASAVYDPASNRMIVFGGDDGAVTPVVLGDTWVLTNANGLGGTPAWVALAPTGTPPGARSAHGAAYDALHDRMIVFGGDVSPAGCGGESADAWVLDHASGLGGTPAWIALTPSGTPPSARSHQGVAYDAATGRLIVSGGDACGVASAETWLLDAANGLGGAPAWSLLAPAQAAPAGWALARYAYDRTYQWLDGFGGTVGGTLADTAYTLTGADGGAGTSWHRRFFYGTRPAPRTFHSMVMANATHTAVVFGGLTASGRSNEVWRRMLDRGPVLDAGPPPVTVPLRTAFALPPSPNPSAGAVRMALDVAHDQHVDLVVFDVNGRRVETLHSGLLTAGRHSFAWGEANAGARRIPPGIYLVRMHAEERDEVLRVVRMN